MRAPNLFERNSHISKKLDQEQAISYYHESNGQLEACIELSKCTMKECCDTNADVHLELLQVRSLPEG